MPSTLGEMVSITSLKLGDRVVGEYFSQPDMKQAIGDSYRYYTMLLIGMGDGYFETNTDLSITANVEFISLAGLTPPFWKESLIEKYVTNGRTPLEPYKRRYKFLSTIGVGAGNTYIPTYKFQGLNLILEPPPGADETNSIRLNYVYLPTCPNRLSVDSFTFDEQFPAIYELNVILRSCVKLMQEKDATGGLSDTSAFIQELAQLDISFMNTMARDEIPDNIEYVGEDYGNIYDN